MSRSIRRHLTTVTAAVVTLAVALLSCSDATGPGTPRVASVTASADSARLDVEESVQLSAVVRNESGRGMSGVAVAWHSTAPLVASVDAGGRVQAMAAGTAAVVATAESATDTVHVVVSHPILTTSLELELDTLRSLGQTRSYELQSQTASGPRTGIYTVASRDPSIATATVAGDESSVVVTAAAPGSAWIVVTESRGTKDSVLVVVKQRVTEIALLDATFEGVKARTGEIPWQAFDARGSLVAGAQLVWTSSDSSIVRPDDAGLLQFVEIGSALVTASSDDASATSVVSVVQMPRAAISDFIPLRLGAGQLLAGIVVSAGSSALEPGLIITPGDAEVVAVHSVAYGSSGASITLHGKRPGTTTLVVGFPGYLPDTAIVHVNTSRLWVSTGLFERSAVFAAPVGATRNVSVELLDSLGSSRPPYPATATLRSSDPAIVAVSGTGEFAMGDVGQGAIDLLMLSTGTATIHVESPGLIPDSLVVRVEPGPSLAFHDAVHVIGAGQASRADAGRIGTTLGYQRTGDLDVAFTQRHPEIVELPAVVPLPSGYTYRTYGFRGLAPGADTIVATAPGFTPDTLVVVVTTPRIAALPPTIDALLSWTGGGVPVQVTDSLGNLFAPAEDITFQVTSDDHAVVRPTGTAVLPAGYTFPILVPLELVDTGTAVVSVRDVDGRMPPRTATMRVMLDTTLRIYFSGEGPPAIGARQRFAAGEFRMLADGPVETFYFESSDPDVLVVPPSATVSAIPVAGGTRPGTATFTAWARGYRPVESPPISVGRPRLSLVIEGPAKNYGTILRTLDQFGRHRASDTEVRIRVDELDPGITAGVDEVVLAPGEGTRTIPVNVAASGPQRLAVVEEGVGDDPVRYVGDTAAVRSDEPRLTLSGGQPLIDGSGSTIVVGVGQIATAPRLTRDGDFRKTVVSMERRGSSSGSAAQVTMESGEGSLPYPVTGLAAGTDSLLVTAEGYAPDTAVVLVTTGRVMLEGASAALAVGDSIAVRLVAGDSIGTAHPLASPATFMLSSSGGISISDGENPIGSVTLQAGQMRSRVIYVRATAAGEASIVVRHDDYSTLVHALSVTSP